MNVWETLVFFVIIWCIVEVYGAAHQRISQILFHVYIHSCHSEDVFRPCGKSCGDQS